MNAFSGKTFKSGNSVALRLPKALGVAENVAMTIERRGDAFIVRPVRDPAEEKRRVLKLIETLNALPSPGEVEIREPPMPPKRVDE
jgi:antitoxin VapB